MNTSPIPSKDRKGILSGGNWILDRVKMVDHYPQQERLANILSESLHNGGSPYNVLTDLSKLGARFPLVGVGLVGEDSDGEYIISHCRSLSIDTAAMKKLPGARTSFTDVFTERESGKRTFFHYRGANALLDIEHFPLETSNARIFHLGYLLLLDRLDAILQDGRPQAYHLLAKARSLGFKTAVDIVSEDGNRFAGIVLPTLPAVDYLFLNEFEAEKITGIKTTGADSAIDPAGCRRALEFLIEKGVREWVAIHFPKGSYALSSKGEWVAQGSVRVPKDQITGTVGAGDAFAAGVLFGLHEGIPMQDSLALGVSAAATCLLHPSSSEGVLEVEGCLKLKENYGCYPIT